MTTAARPTFDPAKGKESTDFTYLTSAKDLPGHTKLKTRGPGQGGHDGRTAEELRQELEEAERRHFDAKQRGLAGGDAGPAAESEKTRYIEMAQQLDAESEASDDGSAGDSASESGDDEGGGSGSESESEDETAMLMRELEKIKRERAEERAREEQEAVEQQLAQERAGGPSSLLAGNPLLAKHDFAVKRRWDDDVVFRDQARGEEKPRKRFINDMLRSDFHRKFMRKYIH
ncbi:complexed with cef1p [Coemansia helicoidea]|uniref:Complexed with cef1p n=1 Tax=Coemansia helicoidea TaxID=1286919 RepID=A0ACC1LB35_9FUNG|nr:complexed with cef1p [Coemansia helicoidea]